MPFRKSVVIAIVVFLGIFSVFSIGGIGPAMAGQIRWTGTAPSPRPATRPPSPSPSAHPPPAPPFRASIVYKPPREHRMVPVRLPWFGLIAFDSAWWAPDQSAEILPPPVPSGRDDQRPTGGLQLDVEPRRALVYVDGWQVGKVESFSGYYSHLDLAAGAHIVEFLATDYEPFTVEVLVTPGRTTTYRGALNRIR
jgi:hypothetical protein